MSADYKRFYELQKAVEDRKAEAERAQGAYDQLMSQLKQEHGIDSLPKAKKALAKLEEEQEAEVAGFNRALKQYEKEHGTELS